MEADVIPPETLVADTLAPLQLADKEIAVIAGIDRVRRSPHFEDTFEVEIVFNVHRSADARRMSEVRRAWMPISELGYYVPGRAFSMQGTLRSYGEPRTRLISKFHPDRSTINIIGSPVEWGPKDSPRSKAVTQYVTRCYVQYLPLPPVIFPVGEATRFYLGTLSLIADDMLEGDEDLDQIWDRLVDRERTGPLGDGKYQIAPVLGLRDRASATLLALLHASPDLLALWNTVARAARLAHVQGEPVRLAATPPPDAQLLCRTERSIWLESNGSHCQGERVIEIIADRRVPPFSELIVHVPTTFDGDREPSRDHDTAMTNRTEIKHPVRRIRDKRPSRGTYAIADLIPGLSAMFPRLRSVKVDYAATATRPPNMGNGCAIVPVSEVSSLSPGGKELVARLVHRPIDSIPTPPNPARETGRERLLSDVSFEMPTTVQVAPHLLVSPLRQFLGAAQVIEQHGEGRLFGRVDDRVAVLELPPEWGRATVMGSGRSRHAGLFTIELSDTSVWAFDLERRSRREHLAMALVCREDGDALDFKAACAVLRYAMRHLSRDEQSTDWQGTWPPEHRFADVRCLTLVHTPRRRENPGALADALVRRAQTLVDRARSPASSSAPDNIQFV